MTAFQWSQSDVDWFIAKFKNEEKEIDARIVQRKYNNKPTASDFRQLMRLVVKSGYARVTNGCVSSKRYKIRMVSEQNPYRIDLFDKELIECKELNNIVPDFYELLQVFFPEMEEYNFYQEEAWDNHRLFVELIVEGFSVYNLQGGDYDIIWESDLCEYITPSDNYKDSFFFIMNVLVAEYTALKVIIPEVIDIARKTTGDEVPGIDPNDVFINSISAVATLSILKYIEELTIPFSPRISDRTHSNTIKEFFSDVTQIASLTDKILSRFLPSDFFGEAPSSEYIELLESALILIPLGATEGLSEESLNALKNVKEAYTQAALFLAGSFLMT
jgi:hypothetical protein